MVLYFTGTGNSRYIAERIAEALGDKLLSMNDCVKAVIARLSHPISAWLSSRPLMRGAFRALCGIGWQKRISPVGRRCGSS